MTAKKEKINFKCGRCEKKSDQQVVAKYVHTVVHEDEDDGYYSEQQYPLRLSLCSLCDTVNYTVEFDDGEIRVLYPTAPKQLNGLPDEVAKAYKAARAVRLVDPNAFAVLLGRVLDLVCLNRNAKGESLNDQLRDLASKGEIPGRLADMAHQLRLLRNIGAHASVGELTSTEVPILDDLCVAILDYVYTSPNRIAQVEQRIQKLKNRKNKSTA